MSSAKLLFVGKGATAFVTVDVSMDAARGGGRVEEPNRGERPPNGGAVPCHVCAGNNPNSGVTTKNRV